MTNSPQESRLAKPREEITEQLQSRIAIGKGLIEKSIGSFEELKELEDSLWKWHSYNAELAKRSFTPTDNEYYQEVRNPTPSYETLMGAVSKDRSLGAQIKNIKNEIRDRLKVLEQLLGRIDLIPVSNDTELSDEQKLHSILEYMIERQEKDNQQCFTSEEIRVGLSTSLNISEIEYLCVTLIDDGFVRDIRSKDGFGICTNDATSQAYFARHYLKQNQGGIVISEEDIDIPHKEQKIDPPSRVFIVHGHNDHVKIDVARTIEKLGLEAIILHEKANSGLTIIEKFERHSDVDFAIILLTDDDLGHAKGDSTELPRARQNVVLEMGYFIGTIGRQRTCILYTPGVELPSDVSGILYTRLDDEGAWKIKLAKELIESGFEVDPSNIV